MKLILKILGGLAGLVLLLVVVAFFLPRQYQVQRAIVIRATADTIMEQTAVLRQWKSWSAWHERDPKMKLAYSEQTTGVGAWVSWESKNEGNGKMTITEQTPTKLLYALEFPDYGMKSNGTMEARPESAGTRLTWSDEGDLGMNPMNRWFGLFLDKFIGTDFDRSLANLKKLIEK